MFSSIKNQYVLKQTWKLKMKKVFLWGVSLGFQFLPLSCEANPFYTKNPLDEGKKVEYFVQLPPSPHSQNPLILFIHGHQPDPRPGGKILFEQGLLNAYTQKGFLAVAVSQSGYGNSDGPPDFCGPFSQAAVRGVINELKKHSDVNPFQIFLHGVSRGALVASMVAIQDPFLGGVILDAGFYDLRTVADSRTLSNIKKETLSQEDVMHLRSSKDYISQIKSPILMFHGFNDIRAPVK
jgi:dipeptidyl aminopeptidase/acylaminoacyl peptidase